MRSNWKLPYINIILFQKRFLQSNVKLKIRNSIIPFLFIEKRLKLNIYNGIWYLTNLMSNLMIKCKFGEFAYTKRSDTQTHLKKKRKKKSSKNKK